MPGVTTDAAYWDEQASTFDQDPDHGLSAPATRAAWAQLLLGQMPSAPARVVDLGCGTGTLSVLLAEAGHDVTGVDYAPRMVEAARAKASNAGVPAAFLLGDATAPPVAQGAFDVVLVRHVLWALPEPHAAVAAWCRLLTPQGRLLLVEGRWHSGFGLSADQAQALVHTVREEAHVEQLTDPVLWGGPLRDERYLLVSRR
jgi:SAM-dependent methyltransferase